MSTTQNNNEFLEGESNSRENFENKWNFPSERLKVPEEIDFKWIEYKQWKAHQELKYGKNTIFNRDNDCPGIGNNTFTISIKKEYFENRE